VVDPPTPPPPAAKTATIRGFVNFGGTYTVTLKRNNVLVGTPVVTTRDAEPPFEFTDVPVGDGYTIEVDNGAGSLTIVRPFTVPEEGLVNVDVLTRLQSELEADETSDVTGTPLPPSDGTATLVAYPLTEVPSNGAQIVLDSSTPTTLSNPTWLPNVTAGAHQLMVLPDEQSAFAVNIPANAVVVIRALYHRLPQATP
jgi:hypothetical protein